MVKSALCRYVVIAAIFGLLSASAEPAQAQAFHRIFRWGMVTDLSWSADGHLSFKEGESSLYSTPDKSWYEYFPEGQILAKAAWWPRQPSLSADELAFFRPTKDIFYGYNEAEANKVNVFIFSSPNGRYIVFPSEVGGGHRIWIADRQTGQMAETYTSVRDFRGGLHDFNVVWNRPGTAFIVTSSGDGYGGSTMSANMEGYMTNFTENVADIKTMSPWDMNLTVDGVWHAAAELYGISDDGKHVLLNVYGVDEKTSFTFYRLLRWNADTNTSTLIGDFDGEKVSTAMFDNGDPDRIVVLSDRGVSRFTISNGYHQILSNQLTKDDAIYAVFSNDGRRLAVDGGTRGVFVFDLSSDFIGLKTQSYTDASTRLDESEIIFAHLNVVNTGDWPLDLSKVKVRYYFNSDSEQPTPMNAVCWMAMLKNGCEDVTVGIVAMTGAGYDDAYIEIGFREEMLAAHGETGDIAVRVNKQDWSDFYQPGHFSFDTSHYSDTFVDSQDIPAYYDGTMVWGLEPEY